MADNQTNITEEWRPVVGYEGLYSVSDAGRVRSHRNHIFLKPYIGKKGYAHVTPSRANRRVKTAIHTLVANAFIGLRPIGQEVNHKNGRKADNRLDNLEYVSQPENVRHAYRTGLAATGDSHYSRTKPEQLARGERSAKSDLTEDRVREIRHVYANTKISYVKLAVQFGITAAAVGYIVRRESWTYI